MPLLNFPDDMFCLRPGKKPLYGEFPELKMGVDYFKSLMTEGEWEVRRKKVATRFYNSLVGNIKDSDGDGRFYFENDLIAWYLFLGEAYTDHPQNYEIFYGSKVIPVFAAIGRNGKHIPNIRGFEERALKILKKDMNQPNGGLFEMLVALAYKNDGAEVSFHPEKPGVKKTYDLDVVRGNNSWAIECKRMELGEYAEFERQRMRELWNKPCLRLVRSGRSIYLKVSFKRELSDVQDNYLEGIAKAFLESKLSSKIWNDDFASGVIGDLDLQPIKLSLKKGYLLYPGPVYTKLLTGSCLRYDSFIIMHKVKLAPNPHFIKEIDQAVVARWESISEKSLNKKARDIRRKLAIANSQLPTDKPGIIHIGIESLGADEIEHRRHEKIMETINDFDPGDANLHFIYWHFFSPESSPDETWAFDETTQWRGIKPANKPLNQSSLVIPPEAMSRIGTHWDGEETETYKDK